MKPKNFILSRSGELAARSYIFFLFQPGAPAVTKEVLDIGYWILKISKASMRPMMFFRGSMVPRKRMKLSGRLYFFLILYFSSVIPTSKEESLGVSVDWTEISRCCSK